MNDDNTEIRRLTDGSIDIEYYIRHCHLTRSLSAHRTIGRAFNYPWILTKSIFLHMHTSLREAEETSITLNAKVPLK
jgi:hypothetical protein